MTDTHAPVRTGIYPHGVVTITPAKAVAFGRCPLHYDQVYAHKKWGDDTPARACGRYIHDLIYRLNLALLHGQTPDLDLLLARVTPPVPIVDVRDTEQQHDTFELAWQSLSGYRAFLDEQGFRVLAAEQYIRIPPQAVRDLPDVGILLSGRIDVALAATDDSVTILDIKTGELPNAAELGESPASAVYTLLARHAYPEASHIRIAHLAPHRGLWVSVELTEGTLEDGRALCRAMARAVTQHTFPAVPGPHCSSCEIVDQCPAHRSGEADWTATF